LYKPILVQCELGEASNRYAAFVRGINMIGRRTVKMADLREAFESMGFVDVATILASGNVVFGTRRSDVAALSRAIERKLEARLGYRVGVIVRTPDELEGIAATHPFRAVQPGPRTKLLITLLSSPPDVAIRGPYASPDGDFTVLRATDRAVFSVVKLTEGKRSSGLMSFLERRFGSEQTTRNWNTIQKVLQARKGAS
jgi:uncharacterized protein (DUF1697 family)